jgi:hypothetical protein
VAGRTAQVNDKCEHSDGCALKEILLYTFSTNREAEIFFKVSNNNTFIARDLFDLHAHRFSLILCALGVLFP